MARIPVWKSITETIESEISAGHYRTGDKLPTEADLSRRFGVNRHTIRRALADLADRNLVRSRRGAGVFVEDAPTDYPIGRRVRFHQNVAATGRLPSKTVLRVETRPSDETEANALQIAHGDMVIVYEGLSLASDSPIAHFISIFPQARVPELAATLKHTSSVTEALRQNGIADYTRLETRLTAERASATQALHLRLKEGAPVLKSRAINLCPEARPIEYGITYFAGERVSLTINADGA